MKKTVIFGAAALLVGCAYNAQTNDAAQSVSPEVQGIFTPAEMAAPCSEPVILRPRVVESKSLKRRVCCDEKPCYQTPDNDLYVPDLPEIYVISANRTVNTMLTEAEPFYKQVGKIKVWVDTEYPRSADLPGGMDKGTLTLKKRFAQIENVTLVNKKEDADYIVGSKADWYDTATKKVPAIKYDLYLKTPDGNTFGEWSEIVHQAQGDRSWW